jgi:prephenate dehydrogenase
MTIQITLIGLNQIGASFGLALAEHKDQIFRIGVDRSQTTARKAEKMGAVDKTMINLPSSVEKADVVVLSLPVDEIQDTLKIIYQDLKEGVVVIDTSPVKVAVEQWAKDLLPPKRYFVGATPTLNPIYIEETDDSIDSAHADLFKKGLMVITSPPGTDEGAIKLVADLSSIVGSTPLFTDQMEAEGLLAATALLPKLASIAMLLATIDQPGWTEGKKLAGKAYASATSLATRLDESKFLGQTALLNSTNTVRVLNDLVESLLKLRDLIANQDEDGLQKALEHARDGRATWMAQRRAAEYKINLQPPMPSASEMIGRLVGLGGLGKPREPKPKDRK